MKIPGIEKLVSRMFREAEGVVWDIMSGKIGVITLDADGNSGISTLSGSGDDAVPNWNPFDEFGVPFPAYAQSTPVAAIQVGDIIFRGKNSIAWVTHRTEKDGENGTKTYKFKIIKPNGESTNWTPPNSQVLGFDTGVMVLRTLSAMLPGGTDGVNQLSGMMMPMLMASQLGGGIAGDEDDESDGMMGQMKQMWPMMLMMMTSQGQSPFGGATAGQGGASQTMMMQMMNTMMMQTMMQRMMGGGKAGGNQRRVGTTPFRG
jgi:hypothetical protein